MQDLTRFFAECDQGPRLNQLAGFFNETAAGRSGMPLRKPVVDTRLLPNDPLLHRFIELHSRRQGFFDQHYHASIPYRLEEEYRMAHALLRFSQLSASDILFYSLGTAEGTMARTLAEISHGKIKTLSCSPNEDNYKCFMAFGEPANAHFFLGPFHHLSKEYLASRDKLAQFSNGFDFILEDTTFQMYSPGRRQQIEFVRQHLKPDGIFLFLEKFKMEDVQEYDGRETQKDFGFKTHYFGIDEIVRKTQLVLETMQHSQVTLGDMADAIYRQFQYCTVTWSSGNFYGMAASNSLEKLRSFIALMIAPAIPAEYVYPPQPYSELSTWVKENAH